MTEASEPMRLEKDVACVAVAGGAEDGKRLAKRLVDFEVVAGLLLLLPPLVVVVLLLLLSAGASCGGQ